ncbi:MAG: bifunctional phosphopantothenoylcysteine decarboxylase/phosphopantothenate--cysteine ligase CoaBC [Saprospiraceae bacterium]|nr:bifunctional phosphopantothenoylcysteine decarboxylase/phosphopantothenate--cysteine ligase CoaBC [Saprospiraceae bacterium]
MLEGKRILLAITGSIAAYKSAFLTRLLVKEGAEVQVIMTHASTQFISPLTFSTLSKKKVFIGVVGEDGWNSHVDLGLWADLMIIAPATANTLSKIVSGLCDDMVTACYLSARCKVMIAPAMDLDMWNHPATQRNIKQLQEDGCILIPVEDGELASGLIGPGRMAEPEQILEHIGQSIKKKSDILSRLKVLVTAGPTYEDIDPVRYIGNRSSGKMGLALAKVLVDRGAEVALVIGPNQLEIPELEPLKVHRVTSALQMATVASNLWKECQVGIFAAAVADYTPAKRESQKIKKTDDKISLALVRTQDIAATLGSEKRPNQITVGFALETNDEEVNARQKIRKKHFDFIVLNSLRDSGAGFQHDTNKITILQANGEKFTFPLKSKTEVAEDIVDLLEKTISQKKQE